MQISREIVSELGADEDLAELAGLTHDIGRPSYGHNSECALNKIAVGCDGFEDNAQTLRILTYLEPKVLDGTGGPCGLNPTRAALDAACKHPWAPVGPDGQLRHKYDAYQEDAAVPQQIHQGVPYSKQCLGAQTMDWFDDVVYSVRDIGDGIVSSRVDLDVFWDTVELAALADKSVTAFGDDPAEFVEAAGRLVSLPVVSATTSCDGSLRLLVALKRIASELVSHFVTVSVAGTRAASESTLPLGRYDTDLAVPSSILAEVTILKTITVLYVMDLPHHIRRQEHERDRLFRLAEYLQEGALGTPDPMFQWLYPRTESDQTRLRVIVGQLASMAESRVKRLDRRIAGVAAARR